MALLGAGTKGHGVYLWLAAEDRCKQRASMQALISDRPAASLKQDLSAMAIIWNVQNAQPGLQAANDKGSIPEAAQKGGRVLLDAWTGEKSRNASYGWNGDIMIHLTCTERGANRYLLHGVKSQGHLGCTCVA